jgi:hypothetical protein
MVRLIFSKFILVFNQIHLLFFKAGPSPGSEPEIQALDKVLQAKAAQTDVFFSVRKAINISSSN